jgi:hypothetical protein
MTDLTDYERKPKKAKPMCGRKAWFYANPGSIDVYIEAPDRQVFSCRITKRQLRKYIEEMDSSDG